MGAAYYGGMRRIGVLTAGCCVALMACSPAVDAPTTEESTPQVRLPRPGLAWNEDFASNTTLERINVGDDSLLVPLGIRLPDDATVTAIWLSFCCAASGAITGFPSISPTSTAAIGPPHGMS